MGLCKIKWPVDGVITNIWTQQIFFHITPWKVKSQKVQNLINLTRGMLDTC